MGLFSSAGTIVSFLSALIRIAEKIADYVERKRMLDAGRAMQTRENLRKANEALKKAVAARRRARREFDDHGGLPDDYRYTRRR